MVNWPPGPTKKPRAMPGAFCLDRAPKRANSVLCDDRAAELVVQASGDQIDVLADTIAAERQAARGGEVVGLVLHEQVVVFDADRPIRSEAVFQTDADGAAPVGVVAGGRELRTEPVVDAVAIRGHSRTALDVEQRVVEGVTDLAGEQTERVDLRGVHETGAKQRADVAALEVSPVALRFKTEHEGAGLPAIADLTTDGAAGRIVGTFGTNRVERR